MRANRAVLKNIGKYLKKTAFDQKLKISSEIFGKGRLSPILHFFIENKPILRKGIEKTLTFVSFK